MKTPISRNAVKMAKNYFIIASLFLSFDLFAQDPNLHIYLCFGQSNMEGQGLIEAEDLDVDERFRVFEAKDCPNLGIEKETWDTAFPPNVHCYSKLSPADHFGKIMVANLDDDITVGIINVSIGGCDIRLFDKDVYPDYIYPWLLDKVESYNGNPYNYLINLAQQAQHDGVIKGILLHQGEANTGDQNWPNYVHKIYNDMLTDLSLDMEEVPLLAGEMLSEFGNCCADMNAIVNTLPDVIPTAHIISSDGCTGADNAHFDTEGCRLLGTRYAEKMLTLLAENEEEEIYPVGMPSSVQEEEEEDIINSTEESTAALFSFNVFPNPTESNELINITFTLSQKEFVSLKLYNSVGMEISEIVNIEMGSGTHTLEQIIPDLPTGTYFYKLRINESVVTKAVMNR